MKPTALRQLARCSALALCLWAMAPAAQAADCTLSLNDDTVDYGRLIGQRTGEAHRTARAPIATAHRTLTALCKGATAIAVKLDGVDAGNGTVKLGNIADVTLTVTQMTLDGKTVQVGKSTAGGPVEVVSAPAQFRPGEVVRPVTAATPMAGTRLDISLRIDAFRAPQTALNNETTVTSENQFRLVTP